MYKFMISILLCTLLCFINVNAKNEILNINLESLEYSTFNNKPNTIFEYSNLEDFKEMYHLKKLPSVYLTDFLFDGISIPLKRAINYTSY